jgi:hypothetical protein
VALRLYEDIVESLGFSGVKEATVSIVIEAVTIGQLVHYVRLVTNR